MIHDFKGKLLINENFNFEKSFCGDWYSFYTWVGKDDELFICGSNNYEDNKFRIETNRKYLDEYSKDIFDIESYVNRKFKEKRN
ncbi:hypothetical protein [Clostridioides difficile]|nr:hypothetical protein [Clostridioides difficile]MCJ0310281.1 hypothetical protein [Clostridioides difficile]MCJ0377555.1 hypothetical protein [Clostridioides difficile]MCJ0412163.1 hypothetical protein [Clostridioides difficile]MCO8703302.1 hypothetical protein [Clostridioides difficile]MDB0411090.1 hypothetical protein [Clostridioides difficile]